MIHIAGRIGSGKTTLLRTLLGLLPKEKGTLDQLLVKCEEMRQLWHGFTEMDT